MCGDHIVMSDMSITVEGSPPHVRGPLSSSKRPFLSSGITPACAGTTCILIIAKISKRDHPRMCGDHKA